MIKIDFDEVLASYPDVVERMTEKIVEGSEDLQNRYRWHDYYEIYEFISHFYTVYAHTDLNSLEEIVRNINDINFSSELNDDDVKYIVPLPSEVKAFLKNKEISVYDAHDDLLISHAKSYNNGVNECINQELARLSSQYDIEIAPERVQDEDLIIESIKILDDIPDDACEDVIAYIIDEGEPLDEQSLYRGFVEILSEYDSVYIEVSISDDLIDELLLENESYE